MRDAKAYVARNSSRKDISIASAATHLGVTPRYLQRLFEADGTTFSSFLLGQRLKRAHGLLCEPQFAELAVSSIAHDVGFGDLSYSIDVFAGSTVSRRVKPEKTEQSNSPKKRLAAGWLSLMTGRLFRSRIASNNLRRGKSMDYRSKGSVVGRRCFSDRDAFLVRSAVGGANSGGDRRAGRNSSGASPCGGRSNLPVCGRPARPARLATPRADRHADASWQYRRTPLRWDAFGTGRRGHATMGAQ